MPGVECRTRQTMAALASEWQHYALPGGATHYHLANDDHHRGCAIAFRTPPDSDAGAPHILEHTVLCGSQRFPVRDPFFAMLRRSLATELNAVTFPDHTAFIFATQVRRDFDHLLAVYLDAVFAPVLDPRDFAQEGHRLELEADQPQRKGVVFNEMKGAYGSSAAQVEAALARHLLSGTPNRFDAGGRPDQIAELDHAGLLQCYQRWYVPANCCIATYGDLDVAALHTAIIPYLKRQGLALPPPAVQTDHSSPRCQQVSVPLAVDEDPADVGIWSRVWTVGDGADFAHVLDLTMLDGLLLGHAGAPLRQALESSGLGRSLANSGVDTQVRTLLWRIELDGVDPGDYDAIGPLVDRTLAACRRRGFSLSARRATLHQLELAERDQESEDEPFGLALCLRQIEAWNLGQDPRELLDAGPALAALQQRWQDPAYGPALLERYLLQNSSSVEMRAIPDAQCLSRAERAEAQNCWSSLARLGAEGPAHLRREAENLRAHQESSSDFSVLPSLHIADIPLEVPRLPVRQQAPWIFTPRCNGLVTRTTMIDVGDLGDDVAVLPFLLSTLGELGVGQRSYAQQAQRIFRRCTGVQAWFDLAAAPDSAHGCALVMGIETTGLASDHAALADLLDETLAEQRFDEHERLGECVEQDLQALRDDLTENGHGYAAAAARTRLGGVGAWEHSLEGLGHLAWLRQLDPHNSAQLSALGARLHALLARLRRRPRTTIIVGDHAQRFARRSPRDAIQRATLFAAPPAQPGPDLAFTLASTVSHHAHVLRVPTISHADAPALLVAAQVLSQDYLLPRVREQGGAYGAAASYQAWGGTFTCTSYRDPQVKDSLAIFAQAATWLRETAHTTPSIAEAILATIAAGDAPLPPSAAARERVLDAVHGRSDKMQDEFRRKILSVDVNAVRDAAARWLVNAAPARASLLDQQAATTLPDWLHEAV